MTVGCVPHVPPNSKTEPRWDRPVRCSLETKEKFSAKECAGSSFQLSGRRNTEPLPKSSNVRLAISSNGSRRARRKQKARLELRLGGTTHGGSVAGQCGAAAEAPRRNGET